MEITNEIKAKVFAQYLGQKTTSKIGFKNNVSFLKAVSIYNMSYDLGDNGTFKANYDIDFLTLILKPLSAITDEDAIESAKIINPSVTRAELKDSLSQKKALVNTLLTDDDEIAIEDVSLVKISSLYQFLQSRGYDLPHYLLGGKTLQEAGLAVYEFTNDTLR